MRAEQASQIAGGPLGCVTRRRSEPWSLDADRRLARTSMKGAVMASPAKPKTTLAKIDRRLEKDARVPCSSRAT
jgi:hypothetical protein